MTQPEPIAIVGISAIMPDAPTAEDFWSNIRGGRYSISDVPVERWDPELFYDADPYSPEDKTYSKIGGWVREFPWEPMAWKLPVPPSVAAHFDDGQKWSVSAGRSALLDAGWPNWGVDSDRVGVILGSALGGDKYVRTTLRIAYPEFDHELSLSPSFSALPAAVQAAIRAEARERFVSNLPTITEDTMPGELANIMAGRVAALFNLRGPNFTTDAACASALAGMSAAIAGLQAHHYDACVTGGVDHNMGPGAFVRFCKIGALSATGTRPFDAGADGFVMGEGAALFVLKRLSDAEKAGDHVYAVILGIGGSSDGKGKGITAPNPIGQKLAVSRAWENAGADPGSIGMLEAHGTSTRVGDATELGALDEIFAAHGAAPGSIALGSVKSNIGHLKAAAGAAGLFKAVMSLNDKVLPPSLNFRDPNPNVDWTSTPFRVNTDLREWAHSGPNPRRAGVSAFGFGGTNFHVALEEFVPGRHRAPDAPRVFAGADIPGTTAAPATPVDAQAAAAPAPRKAPLRGAAVIGGRDDADVVAQLKALSTDAAAGRTAVPTAPDPALAGAAVRVAIDYADAADLAKKADKAVQAFGANNPAMWKLLRSQGVFVGRGPAPKVAFLFTGQGSQYVNMLAELRSTEPIVREVYDEADRIMTPLLGKPLSDYVFADAADPEAVTRLNAQLLQTEITQPAVLTTDAAMAQLLGAYGITPDLVMGHSLGEYGALVASGALSFDAALEAVSARGREMTHVSQADNGAMAAVFGPLPDIERIVAEVDGYVVVANINSNTQAVIGGATTAVEAAVAAFQAAGMTAMRIPVSHAFHTQIVAGASEPLKVAMRRLEVRGPSLPIVANVTGEFYPAPADTETMLEILGRQIAEPVQFVKGLHTLYEAGARVFVEVGPKKALHGFVEEVLGSQHADVLALFTNHPKLGDIASFNQALCGLYASGLGFGPAPFADPMPAVSVAPAAAPVTVAPVATLTPAPSATTPRIPMSTARYEELGRLFAGVLEQGLRVYSGEPGAASAPAALGGPTQVSSAPVAITGAALGLPGVERVFDDENIARILDGQQFIDVIPHRFREAILDKRITRLVKKAGQDPVFELIDDESGVIKLAGRGAPLDVVAEFGVEAARDAALDRTTRLALGAGLDALRDAGIPLVMRYRSTTLGTMLPEKWGLPESMRDDTGVIFASAFPGYGEFASDIEKYMTDRGRREQLLALEAVRARMTGAEPAAAEVDRRIAELRHLLDVERFEYDRRFIFRCLAMGHSQFAELIGARGPNTQINAACASTTQAVSLAEDWIRAGRCRRVVVVSADDVSSDVLLPWVGSGFLASGAAATEDVVADVATPFDRRRHGMVVGMGAAALVVESAESVRERGLQPICEVLATVTANSAFHGTRLDVDHVGQVMERLVRTAEARGIDRTQIAPQTVFVSHETYTPARGGSAAAEINALRRVFGAAASSIVITNTKGFTGHAMGAGIEDVVAIKSLETGIVPPVPNYKEPDPELGTLNLSLGGAYPVNYALRLAAGFGSQIAMTLLRWTPMPDGRRRAPSELGYAYRIVDPAAWERWLADAAGRVGATLEVDHHRLRIVDTSAPSAAPVAPATLAVQVAPAPTAPVATAPAVAAASPAAPAAPAAPSAPSAPPAPAAAPSAPAVDPVVADVVAIVSEMTGYPPELLDVDLDLEADLGVDTVKQAEVFAAVRDKFNIERDENVALRDFPTLTHVIGWVRDKTGIQPVSAVAPAAAPAAASVAASAPTEATPPADEVTDAVVAIVSEMTGYPSELLDVDLDLEADLGVDTVKQAEVFAAVRDRFGVERDENVALRDFPTLTHVIGWVRDKTGIQPVAAAPAAAPAPAPTASADAPAAAPAGDEVTDAVVSIVADMTGYPAELLDLDLDLEADLGVDTVKQAEVFAAVRDRFNVERDENLQLRDFPTLTHVIGWVRDKTGIQPVTAAAPAGDSAPAAAAAPAATTSAHAPAFVGDFAAVDALPRRVPVPALRPGLSACTTTGVNLGEGARILVVLDEGGVGKALVKKLTGLGAEVLAVEAATPTDDLLATVAGWTTETPLTGVFWLPALDDEDSTSDMDLAGWREALRRRVVALHALFHEVIEAKPFLVTGSRLGGQHGYGATGATAPLGGTVVGFAKSYKRERSDVLVKAVDFPASRKTAALADTLIAEAQADPGCVEIGHLDDLRWGVGLSTQPFPSADAPLPGAMELGSDSVFLITGAAGSIVSAITADLATASGGTFHLLDLAAAPDTNDPELQRYLNDPDSMKPLLAEQIAARGEKATPVLIERELARFERQASALSAIEAVTGAGGTAHYHCVDLRDGEAVAAIVEQIREAHGRIDVLLHAAGLEISKGLAKKERAEFELVFGVKADGWFNLMSAAGDMPIGATVGFSSVAGRFGNAGQTDYAAANDLLCKIASSMRRTRPDTRAIALDWTAWGGIGMATRGSIPKIMEAAGVQMLPPQAGIAWIRRELTSGVPAGEVVVAGTLGMMAAEFDPAGGIDPESFEQACAQAGPMVGEVVCDSVNYGITVHTTLDPKEQPFLDDHRGDRVTALLPGVMGIEGMVEVARLLAPGWSLAAVEDVDFHAPLKFYRDEPRTIEISALLRPDGEDLLAECRIEAERQLPGSDAPTRTTHFTGLVRLTRSAPDGEHQDPPARAGAEVAADDVYAMYFHGPAYQVIGAAWRADDSAAAQFASDLPANHAPSDQPTQAAPRLIELCFQAAGLWEVGREGRMALPTHVTRAVILGSAGEAAEGPLTVTAHQGPDGFDCVVADASGAVLVRLEGYRTVTLPQPLADDVQAPIRTVMAD